MEKPEIIIIIIIIIGHQFYAALSKILTFYIEATRRTSSRKPVPELISKT